MNDLKVSASIMCGNPMKFGWELEKLEKAGADMIHFDMMDGHYVENIAMGIYMLEHMKKKTKIPFDVHLAMFHPEKHHPDSIHEARQAPLPPFLPLLFLYQYGSE